MSEAIKPTPGEWLYGNWIPHSDDQSGWVDVWTKNADGTRSIPFVACKHIDQYANARLIAEAGTVFHNTGLSPVQLVEQRDELLDALQGMVDFYRPGAWGSGENRRDALDAALAALAKCEGVQ